MRTSLPRFLALQLAWLAGCLPAASIDPAMAQMDEDGDGWPRGADCQDENPDVHPGAPELCDEVDQDCDGRIDEDALDGTPVWRDLDQDGYGDDAVPAHTCAAAIGWSPYPGDCDDANRLANPSMPERCDTPWDDDCDTAANEDGATGCTRGYTDADGDGAGAGDAFVCACDDTALAPGDDDCDDADGTRVACDLARLRGRVDTTAALVGPLVGRTGALLAVTGEDGELSLATNIGTTLVVWSGAVADPSEARAAPLTVAGEASSPVFVGDDLYFGVDGALASVSRHAVGRGVAPSTRVADCGTPNGVVARDGGLVATCDGSTWWFPEGVDTVAAAAPLAPSSTTRCTADTDRLNDLGDLDGDGLPELLVSRACTRWDIWSIEDLHAGVPSGGYVFPSTTARRVGAGDHDRDGTNEIVLSAGSEVFVTDPCAGWCDPATTSLARFQTGLPGDLDMEAVADDAGVLRLLGWDDGADDAALVVDSAVDVVTLVDDLFQARTVAWHPDAQHLLVADPASDVWAQDGGAILVLGAP